MKYESPVLDVQKFNLTDIMTNSGDPTEPSETEDTRVGSFVHDYGIPCDGTAHDWGTEGDCGG